MINILKSSIMEEDKGMLGGGTSSQKRNLNSSDNKSKYLFSNKKH